MDALDIANAISGTVEEEKGSRGAMHRDRDRIKSKMGSKSRR